MITPNAACGVCGGWTSSGGMSQFAKNTVAQDGRTDCICGGPLTYVFYWANGGFNTVQASNIKEAREKVVRFETNLKAGGSKLVAIRESTHLARKGELDKLYALYD